jgi:hypothetical protein
MVAGNIMTVFWDASPYSLKELDPAANSSEEHYSQSAALKINGF